jgi:predicted flavoprotein YhiN
MVTSRPLSPDHQDFYPMSAVSLAHVTRTVAVIGGGPAGLMAAETLTAAGLRVEVFDAMPSVGRKFLMAGKGGMNLTHSEPIETFLTRYGSRRDVIKPLLELLNPDALRAWVHGLGVDTFVGTSGRVFPTDMKAAPLLRAWLHRLRESGVQFHMRHRWIGWEVQPSSHHALRFATSDGETNFLADAVVLALGGGSWPRLGSDATWVPLLAAHGVEVAPLQAANCGFDADWSEHFRTRHAGEFLKSVAMAVAPGNAPSGQVPHVERERGRSTNEAESETPAGTAVKSETVGTTFRQGEFVVTESGIEGSLVYALSSAIRERINRDGHATLLLDLAPGLSHERVLTEVTHPRGSRSISTHLRSRLGIGGVKAGLLHECLSKEAFSDPEQLARAIKSLPLNVVRARPIAEAISSAGGVAFEALDAHLMITQRPGVFCAGEMLDWEAPTGGYLLSACFASGVAAGRGAAAYLRNEQNTRDRMPV